MPADYAAVTAGEGVIGRKRVPSEKESHQGPLGGAELGPADAVFPDQDECGESEAHEAGSPGHVSKDQRRR